jgi:hypothetical protein
MYSPTAVLPAPCFLRHRRLCAKKITRLSVQTFRHKLRSFASERLCLENREPRYHPDTTQEPRSLIFGICSCYRHAHASSKLLAQKVPSQFINLKYSEDRPPTPEEARAFPSNTIYQVPTDGIVAIRRLTRSVGPKLSPKNF